MKTSNNDRVDVADIFAITHSEDEIKLHSSCCQEYKLLVPVCMAATRCAHFESNRAPETATAVALPAVRDSHFSFYYYSYAYQAMLEVRSGSE